jgi:hypothetical protein
MGDLAIAAAAVAWLSGPKDDGQTAGAAFIAGALLFQSAIDNKWYKARNDAAGADGGTAPDAAGANGYGMALFTADAAGAKGSIARPGAKVSIGAGVAAVPYLISATPGSLCLLADVGTTKRATIAAVGIGTNKLLLVQTYDVGSVVP